MRVVRKVKAYALPFMLGLYRQRTAIVMFVFFSLSAFSTGAGESDRAIVFKPGQTKASSEGEFSGTTHQLYFSLHAAKGQHLVVRIQPVTPGLITAGVVIYPSGKQDGGPGGVIFDSELDESGKFRIRVTRRQTRVEGKFRVFVELSDRHQNNAP